MSRFAAVPTAALDDERVKALHIRVLTALCSYADKDGWCRVGQDLIAKRARTNEARVSQCIGHLKEWGWVRSQRIGKMRVNVYQVLMDREVDEAIQLPTEQERIADTANHVTCPTGKSDLPTEQVTLADTANPIGTPFSHTASNTGNQSIIGSARARIIAALGPGIVDAAKHPGPNLDLTARLPVWLSKWDLELDILPVVVAQTRHPRTRRLTDFKLIEQDIAAFNARRTQALPKVEIVNERAGQSQSGGSGRHGAGGRGARSGNHNRGSSLVAGLALLKSLRETPAPVPDGPEDGRVTRVA